MSKTIYERGMPGAKNPVQAYEYFKNYNKSRGIKNVSKVVGVVKKRGTYYVHFTQKTKRRTPQYSGVFGRMPSLKW